MLYPRFTKTLSVNVKFVIQLALKQLVEVIFTIDRVPCQPGEVHELVKVFVNQACAENNNFFGEGTALDCKSKFIRVQVNRSCCKN